MTTPNRPPTPDWYQENKPVPPHVGPTQRELMARRIRAVRNFLIGVSFVGAATFTTLAAYHTQGKNNAAAAAAESAPVESAPQVANNVSTTQSPSTSFFDDSQTSGFSAESSEHDHEHESDDGEGVAQSSAPTQPSTSSSQSSPSSTQPSPTPSTPSSASSVSSQPTTPQITAPTTSRHRTKAATS